MANITQAPSRASFPYSTALVLLILKFPFLDPTLSLLSSFLILLSQKPPSAVFIPYFPLNSQPVSSSETSH